MSKIAVYAGKAAYMAKNVEVFLSDNNIDYQKLNEVDIQNGVLGNFDTLIIGGGSVFEIVPILGDKGIKKIQEFVKSGGKYVGICAGAYIASEKYYDSKGNEYKGIGLSETIFDRGKGEKIVDLEFKDDKGKIKLFYCNGPLIKQIGKNEKLIASDVAERIGIFFKNIGLGKFYLFCAHPEGNLEEKISAKDLGSQLFFNKILMK